MEIVGGKPGMPLQGHRREKDFPSVCTAAVMGRIHLMNCLTSEGKTDMATVGVMVAVVDRLLEMSVRVSCESELL